MNKNYKLDQFQVQKQLQSFNSFLTIDRIVKVASFLSEYSIQLSEVIGCGATGVVVKGYDDYNSREVAVKIMINQNSEKKQELEEEINIGRKIKSEFVIKIYEHFYDEDSSCFIIIMEYCQIGDLYTYFKSKKSLEKEEIISLFISLLVGLQDIHNKGIIHSDLKPQNILLAENNKLKICDLGLSKILQNNKSFTTNKGGTPIYCSLEQMCGQVRLESDYYSAGAVLCFLCGLEMESNLTMTFQLKNGVFPDIKNMKQKKLIEIGFQMMQLDPKQRIKPEIVSEKLINLKDNTPKMKFQTEFKKNKEVKNGVWIYFYNDGCKYEGEWKDDKRSGHGRNYWQNGDIYEGEFQNDQRTGQGTYYWKNGDKYVGEWQNNKRTGYGIYYYQSGQCEGNRYEGEWKDSQMSGKGTCFYKNGDVYVGEWQNNKKNGYGIFYYSNSGEYEGDRYEGELKDGQKSGQGSYYYKNGDISVGQYINDNLHGDCQYYYYQDDRQEYRYYINGELQ